MKTVWGGKTLPEEIKMTSQSGDENVPGEVKSCLSGDEMPPEK